MNGSKKVSFEFGDYRLIPDEQMLLKDGVPVQLPNKAFDILVVLIENAGELVSKRYLMESVWHDSFVEEANIQVHISAIRKALDGAKDLIETVPKKGYRFTAPVDVSQVAPKGNGQSDASDEAVGGGAEATKLVFDRDEKTSVTPQKLRRSPFSKSLIMAAVALGVIVAALSTYMVTVRGFKNPFRSGSNFPVASMKMITMTRSGNAHNAAISPDGSFIAYQISSEGRNSLWLTELSTGGNVQIMPPSQEAEYDGLAFSADGQFLYYRAPAGIAPNLTSTLYRIPKVGGSPVRLLDGVDSPVAFSPDGKRLAFIREDRKENETLLLTAAADGGTDLQEVARRKFPDYFARKRPSWSPDGATIACIGRIGQHKFLRVLTADLASSGIRPLTSEKWVALQDVEWLPDSDSLLITAQDDINFGPLQIWRTSVSEGGKAEKVTPEVVNYVGLSLDRFARTLVTTKSEAFNNIWIVGRDERGPGKMVLPNQGGGRVDMSWTRSGRIVYLNAAAGGSNVYSMLPDGSDQVQLTFDSSFKKFPVGSPDDKYIVYVASSQGTEQLWRMDIDGQNPRLLVPTQIYRYPVITLDSKWVMYTTWKDGMAFIWKVSIHGGDSIQMHGPVPFTPDISPDASRIAYLDKQENRSILKVLPLRAGERTREFEVSAGVEPIRWTPDGRAITYIAPGPTVPNLWVQPIDDSPPSQVTNFTYDPPRFCEWSRDQRMLSCVRSNRVRDILLFKSSD
ncbi:MAG: winged helix-turn-helix domain-containing protein [Pyrinomonadaceae bacterium]